MRKFNFVAVLLVAVCLFFAGCQVDSDDDEDTYTVWTDSGSYSELEAEVNQSLSGTGKSFSLESGKYFRGELTEDAWNTLYSSVCSADYYKHEWTKDEIKDWFLGHYFGEEEANRETSWLTTVNHGILVSRTGNVAYMILK